MATQEQTVNTKTTAKATPPPPPIAMPSATGMKIPMERIIADPKFNSRKFMPDALIDEMASSLKRDGQLAPVRVAPTTDGKYFLLYGFRRYFAAKKLEWRDIEATVEPEVIDLRTKMAQNLIENEARADLTTYERAMRYNDMLSDTSQEKPLSQNVLASMVHKTPGYVSRLVAGVRLLHPKLVERWKHDCEQEVITKGTHTSLINFTTLKELIKYDHDMQLRWLDEQVNGPKDDPADDDDVAEDGEDKPDTTPRTTLKAIKQGLAAAEAALKAAKPGSEGYHFAEGAVAALKFAIKPRKVDGILTISDGAVKATYATEDDKADKAAKKAAKKD